MPGLAPPSQSLCDLLTARAARAPAKLAFTFLDDGERDGDGLSWGALETRSAAIAAAIREQVGLGARVLLLFPAGLDFVPALFGAFRARVIAVPAYPPSGARQDRTVHRLRGVIADAGVELVLTTTAVAARRDLLAAAIPELRGLRWLAVEDIGEATSSVSDRPRLTDVALLQYTSGSTSAPRGVMVTHANLMANLADSARFGGHDADAVSVSWLPVNHDMGLIQGVLQPVFSGCPAWLMAPVAFLQRPARWLETITRLRATHSGGPNFAFDLCVRRAATDERLDLRSWRVAFCGSEPVRPATLEAFAGAFAGRGFRREAFRPAYGLAEATLLVTTTEAGVPARTLTLHTHGLRQGRVEIRTDVGPTFRSSGTHGVAAGDDEVRTVVGCGQASPGTRVAIVDPETRTLCDDDRIGEIWIAGASVAAGYWRQPHATHTTFQARLATDRETSYLRSGDLGFLQRGELFVTGRIKDTLIVRGCKHDPHDIELTVESLGGRLRPGGCAAFAVDEGHERIAVAAEVDRDAAGAGAGAGAGNDDVIDRIRAVVATGHGIQLDTVLLLAPGGLPKTTSGKVQRYACRDALRAGLFDPIARWEPSRAGWPLEHSA